MISDDFGFYLKGFSLEAIQRHYMGWGGRVLADTSASAVLAINNHFLITLINAAALIALIIIIARLPLFGEFKKTPFSILVFFLIFSLYWVSNPSLGQTSFWIVGSAHYLWTNVVHFLFLLLFIRETKNSDLSLLRTVLMCLLSLIAGGTNENTALTSLCVIALLSIREFHAGNKNWKLLLYIGGFAAGAAIMLLAPGNFARSANFAEWYALGLGEQLYIHFVKRLPDAIFRNWEVFAVLILLIKCQPKLSSETRFYTTVFVLASFFATAVLLPAPIIPKRTLNGAFIYLLVATSFIAYSFLSQPQAKTKIIRAITLICGVQLAVSYALMYRAYSGATEQAKVRREIIMQGIQNQQDHIEIPAFLFTPLLKERDQFDTHFEPATIAKYYGTGAKITEYPVYRTYSLAHPPVKP